MKIGTCRTGTLFFAEMSIFACLERNMTATGTDGNVCPVFLTFESLILLLALADKKIMLCRQYVSESFCTNS